MKRLLFYGVIIIQFICLCLIPIQDQLISTFGETIQLKQDNHVRLNHRYQGGETIYIDFEIHTISEENWMPTEEVAHNERIYVLLEADGEGIYHVKHASLTKPTAQAHQVVLKGKYRWHAEHEKAYYVEYGFEEVATEKIEAALNNQREPWIITIKMAPWGQQKVVEVN
ncbi:GDYXXLXY domain-containing protein [Lentibacillus saliphilus]|uniref:GDYXXLXY domain-containing protein n=1 Tax=Lentibacillus saliphilus TaxID=2737028 RepID=UPI001C30E060|nr:GDYXXLXY domain-containing protein [Lentibacillus saliphilus]